MTSQGQPRTAFRRAVERGNLVVAEIEAREVGRLDIHEALDLTALIAERDRARAERYAVRWLRRYLDEAPAGLAEIRLVLSALSALGGQRHAEALALLRAVVAS